jgi:hypothetical protein
MTYPSELAAVIADRVFDRIERDRTLIKSNVRDEIADGLLLGAAKAELGSPAFPMAQYQGDAVRAAAKELVKLLLDDTQTNLKTPGIVLLKVESMYLALVNEGWRP